MSETLLVLAMGICAGGVSACAQLVCLWIDIDHSKFEPHSVSHHDRGAVSRLAHRRHRKNSCVKRTRPRLLVQVYLPSVHERYYRFRREMITRDITAAYTVLTGSMTWL